MKRQEKEEIVEDLATKYETEKMTNKRDIDIALFKFGQVDVPKDFDGIDGHPIIMTKEGKSLLYYTVHLGLNPKIKETNKQRRQEMTKKKKKLKAEIKEMTKKCVTAIRHKDLVTAQELTAKIEKAESDLANL